MTKERAKAREVAISRINNETDDRGSVLCPLCRKVLLYDKSDALIIRARCVSVQCLEFEVESASDHC